MKAVVFLAAASVAAAASMQEVIDNLFDKYLPQKATWEEVKACRAKCGGDEKCIAICPRYDSPCQRVVEQCHLFNSSIADAKACHKGCQHDFACHFKCPMAKPTTMKELRGIAEAMVCHTRCGHDKACHGSTCTNPWAEKQARCDKVESVVQCIHGGGSHSTCPRLDNETWKELSQEPWSVVKDIANHVADYLLPVPEGQDAAVEDVRACHMRCGHNFACHKNCPSGAYGRLKDQCAVLDEASACHNACEHSATKCQFEKMECHFKCPMSMPSSVKELQGLTEHVLCHTSCGQDKACHQDCPNSNWEQKKAQCMEYKEMEACHKGCGSSHSCHITCPRMDDDILKAVTNEPNNVLKDVIDAFVV